MMICNILFHSNPSQEEIAIIGKGIQEHAKEKRSLPPFETFAFFLHNEEKNIVGGCTGVMYYNCLSIDMLWVNKSYRGRGYGKELMLKAEAFGKQKGCVFSTVNTMDFEALDFYKHFGYQVDFERRGYQNNSTFYFLRKIF